MEIIDSQLSLYTLIAYGIGTFVGIMLMEFRFEKRVAGILREMADEGFLKHTIEDNGDYIFHKQEKE